MLRIHSVRNLLALWLLAALGGCAVHSNDARFNTSSDVADLPPKQAAQLCVITARQLEAAGYEYDAIDQYERARRFVPTVDVSARLAVLYDRQGNDSKALAEYESALRSHPHDPDILNDFACFYLLRGQPDKAEKLLRAATQERSASPRVWINLGVALAKQGRDDESFQAFTHVLTDAQAKCNLGVLLAQRGDSARAKEMLGRAVQEDSSLTQARTVLAWLDEQDAHGVVP